MAVGDLYVRFEVAAGGTVLVGPSKAGAATQPKAGAATSGKPGKAV